MGKKTRQSSKRGSRREAATSPACRSGEMGEGETDYAAIDVFSGDAPSENDHQGLVPRADSEPEVTTTTVAEPGDAETPSYAEETLAAEALAAPAIESEHMSRERRLTLQQLERFRRAATKQGRNSRRSRRVNGSGDMRESFDNLFTDDPSGLSARELRVCVYPWAYWVFGLLIVVGTSVFIERVRAHALGYTPEEASQAHDWWKYLVATVVYAVALGFICNGRVETLVMSKDAGTISLRSSKPLCVSRLRRERRVERELRSIVDIRVEASGEFSGDVDTRCYKVHFEFSDGVHASALESRSKCKTLRRCGAIKDFLFSSLSTTDVLGNVDDVDSPDAVAASGAAAKYEPPLPLKQQQTSSTYVGSVTNLNSIAAAPLASIPSASLPRKVSTATAAASVTPTGNDSA